MQTSPSLADGTRLLSADAIMDLFIGLRKAAVEQLLSDPKKFANELYTPKSAISIDKKCLNGALSLKDSKTDEIANGEMPINQKSTNSSYSKKNDIRKALEELLSDLDKQAVPDTSFYSENPLEELDLPPRVLKSLQASSNSANRIHKSEMIARGYTCSHCVGLNSILRDPFPLPESVGSSIDRRACVPIQIEHGAWEGVSVLYIHEKVYPVVRYSEKTTAVREFTLGGRGVKGAKAKGESKAKSTVLYLGLDSFTSRAMINWVLQESFNKEKLRNNTEHIISFVCGTVGTHVVEAPSVSSFSKHKSSQVAAASLYQAMQVLAILKSVEYSLLSASFPLSFIRSSQEMEIAGKIVKTPLTLLVGDLSNAAVTLDTKEGPLRLYNASDLYKNQTIDYQRSTGTTYMFPDFDWKEEKRFAQRGVSGQAPQVEVYVMVAQLMLIPDFKDSFLAADIADSVLDALFSPKDRATIIERLGAVEYRGGACNSDVMKLLRGIALHPNAFDAVWSILESK